MVGNLAMNTAYSVVYAHGLIRLPRKQGLLLAALMRDAGRPLPAAHLMDASDMWGSPHTLVVYIHELRKLIGHAAEIRTNLGFGYSIHPIGGDMQRRMTPAEIERAIEVYEDTGDMHEAARATGRHRETVRRALKARGYPIERTCRDGTPIRQHAGHVCSLEEVEKAELAARRFIELRNRQREILRAQL